MRFFFFSVLISFCLTNISNAQLSLVWENSTNASYPGKPVLAQEYVVDSEGNIIVAGWTRYGNYISDQTVFVKKIAQDGTDVWMKTYTANLTDYDLGTVNGLFLDNDDNIILFSRFFVQRVTKYSKDGDLLSDQDYDFNLPITLNIYNIDYLFDKVHQDIEGSYRIGGLINTYEVAYSYYAIFDAQANLMTSRYDLRGDSLYQRSHTTLLHPSFNKTMFLFSSCSNGTNAGLMVSELGAEGELNWTNVNWITNPDINYHYYTDVLRDNSGNFYVAANYGLNDGGGLSELIKLNPSGEIIWKYSTSDSYIRSIRFDNGGNILVSLDNSGSSSSTVLIKVSQAGQSIASMEAGTGDASFKTVVNYNNEIYSLERRNTDGLYLAKYDYAGSKIEELKIGSTGYYQSNNIGFFDINSQNDLMVGYNSAVNSSKNYIVRITDGPTSVKDDNIKLNFQLSQNYPNPFNPSTSISYELPQSGNVKIAIYDILAREVKVLIDEYKGAGSYNIDFNASELSSGTYFYKLESNGNIEVKKMMLIK